VARPSRLRRGARADPAGQVLPEVRPNLGIEAEYKRRLLKYLEEMQDSLLYWLSAQYKATPPRMAMDALPVTDIQSRIKTLSNRWEKNFDEAAPKLASYFATSAKNRSDAALQKILADAGISVPFRQTRLVSDVYGAVVGENVGLIKSIAAEHLSDVEGLVMRSVAVGGDLKTLTDELQNRYDLTRKRAALIARDQNNKATAVITRARQTEMGAEEAVWMHSRGGKTPRPEHVAFSAGGLGGPRYEVKKGAYLEGKWTWPGVEINCRCVCRTILPWRNR